MKLTTDGHKASQQSYLSIFLFRTNSLVRHLLPRVAKLGIKVGLRLIGSVKTGSVYDGTCVINANEVDILVMFDTYQVNNTNPQSIFTHNVLMHYVEE